MCRRESTAEPITAKNEKRPRVDVLMVVEKSGERRRWDQQFSAQVSGARETQPFLKQV